MIVCIAEKPSVARDIADILGARERKEGYIEGNRIPGYLDIRSSLYPERTSRIYSRLEAHGVWAACL